MDRTLAARRVAPVAVFAAVLGGIVLVAGRDTTRDTARVREPRALPIGPASGRNAEDRAAGTSAPMSAPGYWTETRIPDRLLAGLPTEGPAYELTRADESRVETLARALGISGEPREVDGTWVVGSGERTLSVMPYAGTPWYLGAEKTAVREGSGSSGVDVATPATAKPSVVSPCPSAPPGAEIACVPVAVPAPMPAPTMPPQPSDAEARAVMDRVLAALGRADAAVTLAPGYLGKEVTAAPLVDGLPTVGYETRVTVAADGAIGYASGFLGDAALDARYPLLDPKAALTRGGIGYARDLPAIATAQPALGHPDIATPYPAAPLSTPSPSVREPKAIRLGLTFVPSFEDGGQAFLVPAWLLSFEGSSWEEPYVALPDRFLRTPPAPGGDPDQPVCDPSPCPDAPPPPDATDGGGSSGSVSGSTGKP